MCMGAGQMSPVFLHVEIPSTTDHAGQRNDSLIINVSLHQQTSDYTCVFMPCICFKGLYLFQCMHVYLGTLSVWSW